MVIKLKHVIRQKYEVVASRSSFITVSIEACNESEIYVCVCEREGGWERGKYEKRGERGGDALSLSRIRISLSLAVSLCESR